MRQVLAYVQKVFRLHDLATKVADSRYRRRIPVSSVILAWVYGFMTMVRSTEQLGRLLDRRRVQRVVGSGHISADVLARLLTRITNPESVREISYAVIRKAMRNKCWLSGSFAGRLVIAIDGTELFSSCYRKCSACSQRRLADGRIQYYHRAVVAKVVGEAPLILDFEPIAPREGEQAAALRLVCRIHEALPLKQVLVLVDAGYQSPRLMNKLTEFGWHWILPIKDQAPNLRKAIVAHFKVYKSPPGHFQGTAGKRRLRVTHRDHQWCRFWDSYDHPHRILSFTETDIDSGTTLENLTFITSVSAEVMPTRTLWSCAHKRWFIENQGFHVLKHTWSLSHPYVHHPQAILLIVTCLIIAHNLLALYTTRRSTRFAQTPLVDLAQDFLSSLLYELPQASPG